MLIPVDSLDDPRIAPYRNLKDRELACQGERFIAEGEWVVRRLLAGPVAADSLLLADHRAAEIGPLASPALPVYVAPGELVSRVVGYRFHSGVLGCGRRPAPVRLASVAADWPARVTLVGLPEVSNTENMGGLLRISAAFGANAVLLGPRCCDPFYRQSVRVSMGTIFKLTLIHSTDLLADLARLRDRCQVQLIATVLDKQAEPLARANRPERVALLFGNEAQGLPADIVAACDRRVTIPMNLGTDSLNVAVAAGVFLHHFCNA